MNPSLRETKPPIHWERYIDSSDSFKSTLAKFLQFSNSKENIKLDLSKLKLRLLPDWIWKAISSLTWIEYLDLSNNIFIEIGSDIENLSMLEILDVSQEFSHLQEHIPHDDK